MIRPQLTHVFVGPCVVLSVGAAEVAGVVESESFSLQAITITIARSLVFVFVCVCVCVYMQWSPLCKYVVSSR